MVYLNKCLFFVSGDNPYRVDARQISQRASLLQRYLCDEQKELQALYALQALMVHMEQPASKCSAINPPLLGVISDSIWSDHNNKCLTTN